VVFLAPIELEELSMLVLLVFFVNELGMVLKESNGKNQLKEVGRCLKRLV
jgi:hypothetical protein